MNENGSRISNHTFHHADQYRIVSSIENKIREGSNRSKSREESDKWSCIHKNRREEVIH